MGTLETQMYIWAIVWLVVVILVALAFYITED